MTSAVSGAVVVAVGLCVGICFVLAGGAARWKGTRLARMCVGFAAFATLMLVAGTILVAAGRLGDVRISLQALTFAFGPIEERDPITIGGSREADDIVIAGLTPDQPRMPTGALAIGPDPARPGAFRLSFNRRTDEPWIGLVFVRPDTGNAWFPPPQRALGAVPFGADVALCLPARAESTRSGSTPPPAA